MTVLEEVDNVAAVGCSAVTDSVMESLLGLVGTHLPRVEFPLTLTGIDRAGYVAVHTLAARGECPVMTYRYDPLGMSIRIWLLPCSITVSDAKGQRCEVLIDGDMKAGKIRLLINGKDTQVH